MDSKKVVNFIYISFGILLYFIVRQISGDIFEFYQLNVMFAGANHLPQVIAILSGVGLATGCIMNAKSNAFAAEVVAELKKVTWPSQKEIYAATIVVIITLIIMAVILYMFDMLWAYLIKLMIS